MTSGTSVQSGRLASADRSGGIRVGRMVVVILLAVYLVALLVAALWPAPSGSELSPLIVELLYWIREQSVLPDIDYPRLEWLVNVTVFIPIGVLVGLLVKRSWFLVVILIGVDISMVLEILQFAVLTGQEPAWADVVANSLGAGIGSVAQALIPRPGERPARTPSVR